MTALKNEYQLKYKKQDPVVIDLLKGKVPPQAIDVEMAVLGAMMIDSKGCDECLLILKTADVFYDEKHKVIFEAISELYDSGSGVDILTVSQRLKTMGKLEVAGGDYYIISLSQKISSSAHIEFHSRILLQFYIKRRVILESSKLLSIAYDDDKDSLELLQQMSEVVDDISEISFSGRKSNTYAQMLDIIEKRIEFLTHQSEEELTGVHTGYKKLNLQTSGYQPGELIVVAARPGMGKTAYVLKTVIENAKKGDAIGFISLEMSAYQLVSRTVAIDTNFHLSQITKKGFEKAEYFTTFSKHKHRMKNYPILIDDSASSDVRDIIATARSWKRKEDIKLLIIDYLQLAGDSSKSGNREQEISSISRKMKLLAKELSIPVIVLSQLSRAVESRGSSRRPLLSDLRESGAIEQDADIVEFIYRADYYGYEVDPDIESIGANTEIIFAKYRGGAPFTAGICWVGDKTKFMDVEDYNLYQEEEETERVNKIQKNAPLPNMQPSDAFGNAKPTNWSIEDKTNTDDTPF
ncbi:replicative DNA helicase [Flavobacterium sp. NRK1]|uniref:replicative DNA helicase n=1 Tax=Flavobacterium sp. NRK1 TaxID=2954929 RepID=UPI00209348BE|nr:replicative DNA helicase [Flavobacterium sp. NRK1]MCO6149081.1 replicative DNA helicase [Flavobacterium sp. NRK1]